MNSLASTSDYLPLALAAVIGGIFACLAALINRPKVKAAAKAAQQAATKAEASHDAATQAMEAVSHLSVPSDAMVTALLEVVRSLQDELGKERTEKTELRSQLERLWHVLETEYPDVLAQAGVKPSWRES